MRVREIMRKPVQFIVAMLAGVLIATVIPLPSDSNAENPVSSGNAPAVVDTDTDFVDNLNDTFTLIAEQANPSVVTIFVDHVVESNMSTQNPFEGMFPDDFWRRFFSPGTPQDGGERHLRGMGSGVIVDEDGYVLTNNHVVRDADKIQVMLHSGERIDGKLIGNDAKTDLAVCKIDAPNLRPLEFGNSDNLEVGEWVLAIGSPLSENLARTVTSGIVSAKGRSNVGLADYEDFIQTDAAINPGNSGGALVNMHGRLVGINTAIASRSGGFQGIGFAVPINMASKVMDALIERGKVVRGWLGVYIQNIDENLARAMDLPNRNGALVSSVADNSPAQKAGVETGDVILAVNGETVSNVTELRNNIASMSPGTEVELEIQRENRKEKLAVELGQLPEERVASEIKQGDKSVEKLGFKVQTLDAQLAARLGYDTDEKGVVVSQINMGSAAYTAGLREGDLIKKVSKKTVTDVRQFNAQVQSIESGETVLLFAKRGENTFFVAFELTE